MSEYKFNASSNAVQYIYREINIDPQLFAWHDNDNPWAYFSGNPLIIDTMIELRDRVREIANECLTVRQLQIYNMTIQGMSQTNISFELGVCQPSIQKSLYGNQKYNPDGSCGPKYGGIQKKLKRFADADPVCQRLMKRLDDIHSGAIDDAPIHSDDEIFSWVEPKARG